MRDLLGPARDHSRLSVRVLGPLVVERAGVPVSLEGQQITLLSILLTAAGRAVSVARLTDLLWGTSASASTGGVLRGEISALRRTLASRHPQPVDVISTVGMVTDVGYRLNPHAMVVDAHLFESGCSEGRRLLREEHPEAAASVLGTALNLWRGPVFAQVATEPFAIAEIARLNALRRTAHRAYLESLARTGQQGGPVPLNASLRIPVPALCGGMGYASGQDRLCPDHAPQRPRAADRLNGRPATSTPAV